MESIDPAPALVRTPSHVRGLDAALAGGLPCPGLVVVVGGPGSGKSVLAAEVTARGATAGRATVFVSFEESPQRILANTASFGWGLAGQVPDRVRFLDARLHSAELRSGSFDLSGLLATVGFQVEAVGAGQVVLDGVDVLLGHLGDAAAERSELLRLAEWLEERELTALLTVKSLNGDLASLGPYDKLPFLADCVLQLSHGERDRVVTRHLRVVKYRGASHATQSLPMIIGGHGIEVLAFPYAELHHQVTKERIGTGVADLDEMLDGGYHRGASILLSGAPGTAKSSLACAFAASATGRGERVLYMSFDESAEQLVRDAASIGIDLAGPRQAGLLEIAAHRTFSANANEHVAHAQSRLAELEPSVLVIDPVSALTHAADPRISDEAAVRLIDAAKARGTTLLLTSLLSPASPSEEVTETRVSTLADTWIQLRYKVQAGERNRSLTIVKSRGTAHSNQVRELVVGHDGLRLRPVFSLGGEVLLGTLRWEKEEQLREERRERERQERNRRRGLEATLQEARGESGRLARRIAALESELAELSEERQNVEAIEAERRRSISRMRDAPETGLGEEEER